MVHLMTGMSFQTAIPRDLTLANRPLNPCLEACFWASGPLHCAYINRTTNHIGGGQSHGMVHLMTGMSFQTAIPRDFTHAIIRKKSIKINKMIKISSNLMKICEKCYKPWKWPLFRYFSRSFGWLYLCIFRVSPGGAREKLKKCQKTGFLAKKMAFLNEKSWILWKFTKFE